MIYNKSMEKLTRRELFKSGMGLLTPRKEENLEDRVARLEFNQMLINQFTFYLDMGMTDHEARIKALKI